MATAIPDIYLVNGASIPSLKKEGARYENRLFHNNRNLTFTDVTEKAGVGGAGYGMGVAIGDYDNDGRLDIYLASLTSNQLFHNNGDGTFTDVSVETGIARHPGRGMGVAVADYDGDGYSDIFVANDDAPGQLFHNLSGKRFEEVGEDAMVAFSEEGNAISGMGVDFKDVFNTGRPDLWVTAMEKDTFPLFVNSGHGQFTDGTAVGGLALETAQMSGWSNAIVDLDNDGWKDLLVARSNVIDNIALFAPRQHAEPNAVFRNLGNSKFRNVSATAGPGFGVPAVNRGLALGDLDNDGRMDAVISVLNGPAEVFHNTTTNANHWILLKLVGTKSNRMGIGARVRITGANGLTQYNHVTTAGGYSSSSDARVHFRLGASPSAKEIEIRWPSGIIQVLRNVAGNRVLTIVEPRS